MKKVRYKIYETNSSSSNCLILGDKLDEYKIPDKLQIVDFWGGRDFEYSSPDERFTVLASMCEMSEFLALCYKLYKFGVKEIIMPRDNFTLYGDNDTYIYIGNAEINESEREEIYSYLKDDELLKRWLFNNESEISGEDDNYM